MGSCTNPMSKCKNQHVWCILDYKYAKHITKLWNFVHWNMELNYKLMLNIHIEYCKKGNLWGFCELDIHLMFGIDHAQWFVDPTFQQIWGIENTNKLVELTPTHLNKLVATSFFLVKFCQIVKSNGSDWSHEGKNMKKRKKIAKMEWLVLGLTIVAPNVWCPSLPLVMAKFPSEHTISIHH